jgi:hypothetical protein
MVTLDSYEIQPDEKRGPGRPRKHTAPPELREALPSVRWDRCGESQHGHLTVTWWQTLDGSVSALRALWAGGRAEWQVRTMFHDGNWRGTGLTPSLAWARRVCTDPCLPTDAQLDDPAAHLQRFRDACDAFHRSSVELNREAQRALPGCRVAAVGVSHIAWDCGHIAHPSHVPLVTLLAFPGPVWAATLSDRESGDHAGPFAAILDLMSQPSC